MHKTYSQLRKMTAANAYFELDETICYNFYSLTYFFERKYIYNLSFPKINKYIKVSVWLKLIYFFFSFFLSCGQATLKGGFLLSVNLLAL